MDILNRPAIKAEARKFISVDRRFLLMFVAGIVPILFQLIDGAVQRYVDRHYTETGEIMLTAPLLGIFYYLSPMFFLLIAPISVSLYGYYLKCLRSNEFTSGSVYRNAAFYYIKFLITYVIKAVFLFLWFCLLVVPVIIKGLAYSMTEYIINDNPNLDPTEAIRLSSRITQGFKMDLFVMYLSFILWYILGALTLGIGYIYVIPYVNTTTAMYYENLKKHAIDNNIVSVQEFGIN